MSLSPTPLAPAAINTRAAHGGRVSRLAALSARVDSLQAQISTSKRVNTPADDPIAFARAATLRRAQSVAEFLSREAGIPQDRIRTAGMGFDYLKYPAEPLSGANRRVQILLVEG
jgi:hypothetical protein